MTKLFSFNVALSFALNYLVGTGFLTLPWAFAKAGGMLSLLVLIGLAILAMSSAMMVLEAMKRACSVEGKANGYGVISMDEENNTSSTAPTTPSHGEAGSLTDGNNATPDITLTPLDGRIFKVVELCDMFLGKTGRFCYSIVLCVFLYGLLAVYASVFGKSLASVARILFGVPDEIGYPCSVAAYSFIVIPLSCLELTEQVTVQVALTFCRIIMLLIMAITILTSFFCNCPVFADYPDLPRESGKASEFNIGNLYLLLPIVAYANIFHHGIPALSEPVEDKTQLTNIFKCTLAFCVTSYAVVGLLVSGYFGSDTEPTANINWSSYNAGVDKPVGAIESIQMALGFCCRWFVVMFPALDVASAFPLNAIILGNSLLSTFGEDLKKKDNGNGGDEDQCSTVANPVSNCMHDRLDCVEGEDKDYSEIVMVSFNEERVVGGASNNECEQRQEGGNDMDGEISNDMDDELQIIQERFQVSMFRLLAAIPPIALAAFYSNVSSITVFTGVSGFLICFLFPPALALTSKNRMIAYGLSPKTYYSSELMTCDTAIYFCFCVGMFLVIYVSIFIIISPSQE